MTSGQAASRPQAPGSRSVLNGEDADSKCTGFSGPSWAPDGATLLSAAASPSESRPASHPPLGSTSLPKARLKAPHEAKEGRSGDGQRQAGRGQHQQERCEVHPHSPGAERAWRPPARLPTRPQPGPCGAPSTRRVGSWPGQQRAAAGSSGCRRPQPAPDKHLQQALGCRDTVPHTGP